MFYRPFVLLLVIVTFDVKFNMNNFFHINYTNIQQYLFVNNLLQVTRYLFNTHYFKYYPVARMSKQPALNNQYIIHFYNVYMCTTYSYS